MSGFAGIYHLNGCPVADEELMRMSETLAHRGRDGDGSWRAGAVGLVHRLQWTTPESVHESQPLVDAASELVITADARIDNRTELINTLALDNYLDEHLSDSALILAAYARWGEGCVDHLLGDFAFALWDGRQQQLFCARDHFGIKPFYYYSGSASFYFASAPRGLLCLGAVPSAINEEQVAAYLVSSYEDMHSTFYQAILRLPPGHTLVVNHRGISLRRYWTLDVTRELRLSSDADYAAAFREVFAEAIRCRLRSAFPVGAMLSGGMDSSSITCLARSLLAMEGTGRLLHTFSGIYPTVPACDEQQYIQAVLAQGACIPHLVPIDQINPFWAYLQGQEHTDGPYPGTTAYAHWGVYTAGREQGVRVILGGFNGDAIISHGYEYFPELIRTGRWLTFYREARALAVRYHGRPAHVIWNLGIRPLIPPVLKVLHRRHAGYTDRQRLLDGSLIAEDCAEHTQILARLQAEEHAAQQWKNARQMHARGVVNGLNTTVFEAYDMLSQAFGIEERYPFFDRRVVEFCIALPVEQKLRQGWPRLILRRAMEGILPPAIQWRSTKADHAWYFNHAVFQREAGVLCDICSKGRNLLAPYIDTSALSAQLERCFSDEMSFRRDWMSVWQASTLASWLTQRRNW
ncbi:MAG: lasso peptide isopeptide bond-forming cyclase [Armatimonadota bacterium]